MNSLERQNSAPMVQGRIRVQPPKGGRAIISQGSALPSTFRRHTPSLTARDISRIAAQLSDQCGVYTPIPERTVNVMNTLHDVAQTLSGSHSHILDDITSILLTCLYTDGTPAAGLTALTSLNRQASLSAIQRPEGVEFAYETIISRTWFEEAERRSSKYENALKELRDTQDELKLSQRRVEEQRLRLESLLADDGRDDTIQDLKHQIKSAKADKERLQQQIQSSEAEHGAIVDMLVKDRTELRAETKLLRAENSTLQAARDDTDHIERVAAENRQLTLERDGLREKLIATEQQLADQVRFISGAGEATLPTCTLKTNAAVEERLVELQELKRDLEENLADVLDDDALKYVWAQDTGSKLSDMTQVNLAEVLDSTDAGNSRMVELIESIRASLVKTIDEIKYVEAERKRISYRAPDDGFVELQVLARHGGDDSPWTPTHTVRYCLGLEAYRGAICHHTHVEDVIHVPEGVTAIKLARPTPTIRGYVVLPRSAVSGVGGLSAGSQAVGVPPLGRVLMVTFGQTDPPPVLASIQLHSALSRLWNWSTRYIARADPAGTVILPLAAPKTNNHRVRLRIAPADPSALQSEWIVHLKREFGPLAFDAGYRIASLLSKNRTHALARFYEAVLTTGVLQAPTLWLLHYATNIVHEMSQGRAGEDLVNAFMNTVQRVMNRGLAAIFKRHMRDALHLLSVSDKGQAGLILRDAVASAVIAVVQSRFSEQSAIFHKLMIHHLSAHDDNDVDCAGFVAVVVSRMKSIPEPFIESQFKSLLLTIKSRGPLIRKLAAQVDTFSHLETGDLSADKGRVTARTAAFLASSLDQVDYFVRPQRWEDGDVETYEEYEEEEAILEEERRAEEKKKEREEKKQEEEGKEKERVVPETPVVEAAPEVVVAAPDTRGPAHQTIELPHAVMRRAPGSWGRKPAVLGGRGTVKVTEKKRDHDRGRIRKERSEKGSERGSERGWETGRLAHTRSKAKVDSGMASKARFTGHRELLDDLDVDELIASAPVPDMTNLDVKGGEWRPEEAADVEVEASGDVMDYIIG